MKLRNKKTGEIGELKQWWNRKNRNINGVGVYVSLDKPLKQYNSLAELNEEWEDYKEPKEYWFINSVGGVIQPSDTTDWEQQDAACHKEIGNYFETPEEAEEAVEKLKAWKRLKDAGFWFKSDSIKNGHKYEYILRLQCEEDKRFKTFKENEDLFNDLKLLFRGKE